MKLFCHKFTDISKNILQPKFVTVHFCPKVEGNIEQNLNSRSRLPCSLLRQQQMMCQAKTNTNTKTNKKKSLPDSRLVASFDETTCQVKTNTNTNNCYHPPPLLRQLQQTQSSKEDVNAKYKYEYIVAPACFVGLKTTAKRTKEEDLSTNTFFNDLHAQTSVNFMSNKNF